MGLCIFVQTNNRMAESEFIFTHTQEILPKGSCTWKAPSNIALVKYWGKYGLQLPKNSSLSFTLSHCATQTQVSYQPKEKKGDDVSFQIFFEGKPAPHFRTKITSFFERIQKYVPFITRYEWEIRTQNTFPHSSGIASSASGMAALALCIMDVEKQLNPTISTNYFYKKAGFLARLGSGSAARSITGPIMIWGAHPAIENSTNNYAIAPSFKLHTNFLNYRDTILLVDQGQKQVSSSVGHQLMHNHPFSESRFAQAQQHLAQLISILKTGDLSAFVKLVEREALILHAMMMTSSPYFLLMKPVTLEIIQHIWNYRENNNSHVCFTLDAGANVHLLYPDAEKEDITRFIQQELSRFCECGKFITDQLGNGAEKIS